MFCGCALRPWPARGLIHHMVARSCAARAREICRAAGSEVGRGSELEGAKDRAGASREVGFATHVGAGCARCRPNPSPERQRSRERRGGRWQSGPKPGTSPTIGILQNSFWATRTPCKQARSRQYPFVHSVAQQNCFPVLRCATEWNSLPRRAAEPLSYPAAQRNGTHFRFASTPPCSGVLPVFTTSMRRGMRLSFPPHNGAW